MTATHLVLLVHADPSVRARYVEACARAGIAADVVALVADPVPGLPGGGLSARYDALAAGALQAGRGSAVRGLVSRYRPPRDLGDYEHVVLACYSAGYGFARRLSDVDRALLSGLVLIDSGHGAEGLPGAALDWLTVWASSARAGRKVLAIGHTDVDPVTYASTTEVAEAAIARSGPPLADLGVGPEWGDDPGLRRRRRCNGMIVETYDRRAPKDAKAEHGDALTVWGDELVAQACAVALGLAIGTEPLPSAPPAEPARLAAWEGPSHGYRCSVAELYRDAVALGSWVPIADVLAGRYVVQLGELVVSARAGGDPTKGGPGHVERAAERGASAAHPGHVMTIGGNEGNRWALAPLALDGPDVRGIIRVDPRIGASAVRLALEELEAGVAERPGAAHHPRIQAYHAGARRGGSPLAGMPGHEGEGYAVLGARAADEVAWCASAASWCACRAIGGA